MQHALEELDRRYGSVRDYLQCPAGMQLNKLGLLRERLLVSTSNW